jgi:hypothetical protein
MVKGIAWRIWRLEFEKVGRSSGEKRIRMWYAQKLGRISLRGRGGKRRELDRIVGRRNGRPPKPVDPWMADLVVQATHQWLQHLPDGVNRGQHLDANGLSALREVVGQPTTMPTARRIVAGFYHVEVPTLTRKTKSDRVDEARELNQLRGETFRYALRLGKLPS